MGVRRAEPHMYEVTNKLKGVRYHVRFTRQDGQLFASCDCPAGLRHNQQPLVCKHLAAVVIFLRAIRAMKQRAHRALIRPRQLDARGAAGSCRR